MKITREQVLEYVRQENDSIRDDIVESCKNCDALLLTKTFERIEDLCGIFTNELSPLVIPFYAHYLRSCVRAWMKSRRIRRTVREIAKLFPVKTEFEFENGD